jgi:hypothetical protein
MNHHEFQKMYSPLMSVDCKIDNVDFPSTPYHLKIYHTIGPEMIRGPMKYEAYGDKGFIEGLFLELVQHFTRKEIDYLLKMAPKYLQRRMVVKEEL